MIPILHPIHKNCILLALETIAMMNVASVSVRRAGKSDIYARQEKLWITYKCVILKFKL